MRSKRKMRSHCFARDIDGDTRKSFRHFYNHRKLKQIAAAAVLLIRQFFTDGFYPSGRRYGSPSYNPSNALLKAMIINGAVSMERYDTTDKNLRFNTTAPDSIQGISLTLSCLRFLKFFNSPGFGRMNLMNSLGLSGRDNSTMGLIIHDRKTVSPEESHSYPVTIPEDFSGSLCATLTWTDITASLSSQSVINDLDLSIYSYRKKQWYYPNNKNESGDHDNTVEKICIG